MPSSWSSESLPLSTRLLGMACINGYLVAGSLTEDREVASATSARGGAREHTHTLITFYVELEVLV